MDRQPMAIKQMKDSLIHGVDNVEGYTIRQIEDALIGQKTWNGWRNSIKNKYKNGARNNLDALFAAYQ